MAAPERKYTDADVRGDPELAELALDYLDNYTGDFEPLVRAQETLERGSLLTTTQTRVVLNCMRHDWSIADKLPQPMAKVIDMPVRDEEEAPPRKRRKEPKLGERNVPCGNTELHMGHNYERDGFKYWNCRGVSNDRPSYIYFDAKIKVPYAKAKGGKMIHLVAPEGSTFTYSPNQYGDGYGSGMVAKSIPKLWGFYPRLGVNLLCRYPSWLHNPMLLAEVPEGMLDPQGQPIGLCPHCVKVKESQ